MTKAQAYSIHSLEGPAGAECPAAMHSQFVLAKDGRETPQHWMVRTHNGWRLATHPALPVYELAVGGRCAGWVLGWPIVGGRFVADQHGVEALPGEAEKEGMERMLYAMGGRFAAVALTEHASRLYLDAFGSLAAVYCTDSRAAASTPTLLVDAGELAAGYERMIREPGLKYFPAGLTASTRVRRLMPNHYLDLDAWTAVRHWPTQQIERDDDAEIHVDTFFATLQDNLTACLRARPCYIGVTSGRDSRMLLAAVPKALRDRVRCFTFDYGWRKRGFWADVHTGRALARRLGYPWQRVWVRGSLTPDAESNYLSAIGYAGGPGKGRDFHDAARRCLDVRAGWLTGFGGEASRGYYWRANDTLASTLCAAGVIERLSLHPTHASLEAMEHWLEGVSAFDAFLALDLVYLEHRVGCWAMPHVYGAAPFAFNIAPLVHRRTVESAYRIGVDYRHTRQLSRAVVDRGDPRLRGVPFGTFLGPSGVVKRYLTGALRHAGWLER